MSHEEFKPLDAVFKSVTAECITIKHPDSDASITIQASKTVTGMFVMSGNGQQGISIYVDPNGMVGICLRDPHSNMPRLALGVSNNSAATLQISPHGHTNDVEIVDAEKVVHHVLKHTKPDPM